MAPHNRQPKDDRIRCRGRSDSQWDNLFSRKTEVVASDEKRLRISRDRLHQRGQRAPFDTHGRS